VWRIVYCEGRLRIVFWRAWKVFRKFCPLCYKQVITLSPRRIKDKFPLVFSKFSQIALVATRLAQFCENFENTCENLSLILLVLMRLHIQIVLWYIWPSFCAIQIWQALIKIIMSNGTLLEWREEQSQSVFS